MEATIRGEKLEFAFHSTSPLQIHWSSFLARSTCVMTGHSTFMKITIQLSFQYYKNRKQKLIEFNSIVYGGFQG
jgi:hypothetical protein